MTNTQYAFVTAKATKQFNTFPKKEQSQIVQHIKKGAINTKALKQTCGRRFCRTRVNRAIRIVSEMDESGFFTICEILNHRECDRIPENFKPETSSRKPIHAVLGADSMPEEERPADPTEQLICGLRGLLADQHKKTISDVSDDLQSGMALVGEELHHRYDTITTDVRTDLKHLSQSMEQEHLQLRKQHDKWEQLLKRIRHENIACDGRIESLETALHSMVELQNRHAGALGDLTRLDELVHECLNTLDGMRQRLDDNQKSTAALAASIQERHQAFNKNLVDLSIRTGKLADQLDDFYRNHVTKSELRDSQDALAKRHDEEVRHVAATLGEYREADLRRAHAVERQLRNKIDELQSTLTAHIDSSKSRVDLMGNLRRWGSKLGNTLRIAKRRKHSPDAEQGTA